MDRDQLFALLDEFKIETPSWGYADSGTRFGRFLQPEAARTIDEKLEDAGVVHRFTGCCPTVAVHVDWDFPPDLDPAATVALAQKHGVSIGAINPNYFEPQVYKFGSAASPDPAAREAADRHTDRSIEIARATGSTALSLWFADGTNYPGQDDIVTRKRRMSDALKRWHDAAGEGISLLVEYKPFEPAFYHTDIGDWGMAYLLCKQAGPRARVLVDTGHHFQSQNIEQIVAWLIDEDMLGGFHFNDRKYADDDLTLGSIDPYAVFRIFHEIRNQAEFHGRDVSNIAYMVDQSHNLKPKIEAMLQTATTAQELFAKACLVNRKALRDAQARRNIVDAENCLKDAFATDVRPALSEWRIKRGLPADPMRAFRESGLLRQRQSRRQPQ